VINESGILNINTKNLIYNYNFFKKLKKNLIVAPTIKANAYGLGDKKIYNLLLNQGCKHFFVATLNEGLKLNNRNKLREPKFKVITNRKTKKGKIIKTPPIVGVLLFLK